MLRRVTHLTTIGLTASALRLVPAPVQAQSVDCPDGAVVVLDGEQICFPYAAGGVPMQGGPLQVQSPRGGGGTEYWCIRHHDRDQTAPPTPGESPAKLVTGGSASTGTATFGSPMSPYRLMWSSHVGASAQIEEGTLFKIRCYPPQELPPPA